MMRAWWKRLLPVFGLCFGAWLGVGCAEEGVSTHDWQIGNDALAEVAALLDAHPRRIAGEDSMVVATWIASRVTGATLHPFETPYGQMCNVWVKSHQRPVAVLASHFDTKSGIEGFVGANDGASTTGLLIALAREGTLPVDYLFLDGEECRVMYSREDGLHGAWFAASGGMGLDPTVPVIVVDMLGDADFTPILANNGTPALNRLLYRAARMLNLPLEGEGTIVDDHLPFVAQGWRATDVIDFEYGPQNAWWHTAEDRIDKLSVASLAQAAALIRLTVQLMNEETL